jgi:anti-anti-sigma factor
VTLLAHITDERRGGLAIARVEGEIDASNVKWVESRLRALLTNQSEGLVVDLSATTYLDSAGIALWFALSEDLRQHQQQLRLVVVDQSSIARMVRLTGLDEAVPTHPTLETALAEAGGGATESLRRP